MQRSPLCPCCGHNFGSKDGGQVSPHGSRLPLLLQCGHTVCEGCLNKMCHGQSPVSCPICQLPMSMKEGGVKSLMVDAYVLGLVLLSKRSTIDRLKSPNISFQLPDTNSSISTVKRKESKVPKKEVCVECATKAATCRCDKCETVLCTTCFDKVHKPSRSLRLHQALPLQDSSAGGVPTICTKHSNRIIEYFCEDDQEPICADCVIVGDHMGHGITAMEIINKKAFSGIEPAVEQASKVLLRMKRSDKMMSSAVPGIKAELQEVVDDISRYFRQAHGLLQAREIALLEELVKKYEHQGLPLEQLRTQLQSDMWNLDQSVKEAKQLLKEGSNEGTACSNAQGLLKQLQQSTTLPCFAMKVDADKSNLLKCSFSSNLASAVGSYGEFTGALQVSVTMKAFEEVPTELLEADIIDSAPPSRAPSVISDAISVNTDIGTLDSEADTDSVSTLGEFTVTSTKASEGRKKQQHKSQSVTSELVYVTHIKNPCHFLVQKCSDFASVKQLQKTINKHCAKSENATDIPVDVTVGDYVLSQFQSIWYRARVTQELTDPDMTNPKKIKLEVFYIDYGNTAVVCLTKLRDMKSRFMNTPELVKTCSLIDIRPFDGSGQWSQDAVKAFARMNGDKPMQMLVKREEDNLLYVELCKPGCDDIADDRPVSVRDTLVFLELACFATGSSVSSSPGGLKPSKQYFRPAMLFKDTTVPCMVSFVESPQRFFIQQINEDVQYMHEMMTNIQHTYTQDNKDLYTIFCPHQDMVCAAHYALDDAWYRAQVIELPGHSMVKVRYVDYGNEEYVTNWELQKLVDKYMVLPIQSLCCELADVSPQDDNGWSQECVMNFAKEVTPKKMAIEVQDVRDDKVLEVVLMELLEPRDVGVMEPICFNSWLVNQGYALSTGPSSKPITMERESRTRSLPPVEFTSSSDEPMFLRPSLPPGQRLSSLATIIGSLSEPIAPGAAPKAVQQNLDEASTEKPSTMEVTVSHIITPGHMYMHLAEQSDDRLQLMVNLGKHMLTTVPTPVSVATPGLSCLVKYPADEQWYRAEVISLQDDKHAKVQLLDYGYESVQDVSEIYLLPEKFSKHSRFSFLCHLSDLQPAGDPTRWTRTSIEFFTDLLKDQVCFIQIQKDDVGEGSSVGVDLLKTETIKGDALTGDQVVYTSIKSLMLDKGLALPKRKIQKILPKNKGIVERGKSLPPVLEDTTRASAVSACGAAPLLSQTSSLTSVKTLSSTQSENQVTNKPISTEEKLVLEDDVSPAVISTGSLTTPVTDQLGTVSLPEESVTSAGSDERTDGPTNTERSSQDDQKARNASPMPIVDKISASSEIQSGEQRSGSPVSVILDSSVAVATTGGSSVDPVPESSQVDTYTAGMEDDTITEDAELNESTEIKIETDNERIKTDSLVISVGEKKSDVTVQGSGEQLSPSEPLCARKGSETPPPLVEPKEQVAPSPPVEIQNYKVPDLPNVSTLSVVPTYVDYDCHVFVQSVKPDDDPEGRLGFVLKENTIEVKLQNSYFEKMKLHRAKIIRDGNCMFRAFAQQIFNDQNRHMEVRQTVIDTLQEYWFLFENILSTVPKVKYISEMAETGSYGGEPEIQAVCYAYQVQVELFMGGLASPIMCRSYGNSTSPLVKLSYVSDGVFDSGHYDLVVDSADDALSSEVAYGKWRAQKIEDYQLSDRLANNNLYENSILDQLMAYLQNQYKGTPPESYNAAWTVGQALVGQYSDDNLFYRARILDILDTGYKVKYVDFGNEEIIPVARLRSDIVFPDIPVQCYECIIDHFMPATEDGKWSVPALNGVHQCVVGNTYVMHIKDVLDGHKLVIDLESNVGQNVVEYLCQMSLGVLHDARFDLDTEQDLSEFGPRASSPIDAFTAVDRAVHEIMDKSVDHITVYGIPERTVQSPYPQQMQLKVDDCVPCSVTQVDYPNVVYLQRVKQEDADEAQMLAINMQLDQLLKVLEVLNTDHIHYRKISHARPGMACCAQYSADQSWYRAEILSVGDGPNHDLCGVLFVDYGSSDYISKSSLLELPTDLMTLPVQAVRCHLTGIHPPDGGDTWDPTVTLRMTEVLASQTLMAVVKHCTEDIEVVLHPQDQFFAIGMEAQLAYQDLIHSRVIMCTERSEDEDSEAIIEETYEEDLLPAKASRSWAEMAEQEQEN